MIAEIPKSEENEVSMLTQNLEAVAEVVDFYDYNFFLNFEIQNRDPGNGNLRHQILGRGFNRFRDFGVDMAEVHLLRILFHTAHIAHSRESKYLKLTLNIIF